MLVSKEKSLRRRVILGGVWSIAGHFISQGIRLGGNLITTRLLMPEMFGVMAIANVLLIGIEMLSDLGVRQNIVQSRRGDDPVFLNTAWAVQIIRGALLGVIVLLMGGFLYAAGSINWFPQGSVYSDKILPFIIAVLALIPLIAGLESTKLATASRNLALGHMTVIEILAQVTGPAVIITWCYYYERSIWALVAGWFVVSLTRMILSHTILPGINNKWAWDRESAKDIYHFGKWIFVSSILGFLLNNGDRLLIGAFLSTSDLGVYSIAMMSINAVEAILRKVASGISYPALCEIYRDRRNRFCESYYKFRLPIDIAALLSAGVLFSSGQAIMNVLYDSRYQDAGWMLQLLGMSLFSIRYDVSSLCYLIFGKPKLLTLLIFARVIGLYLFVPISFLIYGKHGGIMAIALNFTIGLPILFWFNLKNGIMNIKKEIIVLPLLVIGVLAGELLSFAINLLKL